MNKTTADPCSVCGSTDVNLVDGYYYCIECGTQDTNVVETLLEDRALEDGTFSIRKKKMITVRKVEKKEMSPEWYKWHAYNFVLEGLTNELVALGANKSFKMKVLWLWTEYMKKYQIKEALGQSRGEKSNTSDDEEEQSGRKRKKKNISRSNIDVTVMKKSIIIAILYSALNLDGSDIYLSDLLRYIQLGYLDFDRLENYLPKEIKVNLIPGWRKFIISACLRQIAEKSTLAFLKYLSIPPRMPDLRPLVDRYVKELCLPNDFKDLVFSLMHLAPCDYLEVNRCADLNHMPNYECIVMSYICVAFKMCFGLDDDYDKRLSDAVDKVNNENCFLKSFKLGTFSVPSDRLFSFNEWRNFIQFRKIILSKYNLYFSEEFLIDVDDYVYMEQRKTSEDPKKIRYSDEIVMKLLNKIPQINKVQVIPNSEFKPTLTPFSTYTEIILQYYDDPDLRSILSEDFSQYSLKYATQDLFLHDKDDTGNIVTGVNDTKKEIKSRIVGTLKHGSIDCKMVYVRNCDNKNWIKTNQPTLEHIKKTNEISSGKDIDSNGKTVPTQSESTVSNPSDLNTKDSEEFITGLDLLKEKEDVNIFDDDFKDLIENIEIKEEEHESTDEPLNIENSNPQDFLTDNNIDDDLKSESSDHEFFNPKTFDREKTIRELVLAACKKYKARIPNEYDTKEPKKRKANFLKDKVGESNSKRKKLNDDPIKKKNSVKGELNNLLDAYYKTLQSDVLFQLSEHVKTVVNNVNMMQEAEKSTNLNIHNDTTCLPNVDMCDESDNVIESHENNENNNEDLDQSSSVICMDETKASDDKEIGDPTFDEKTHDIKQLYVEVGDSNDASDSGDAFDIADDPEVAEIIDKAIAEIDKSKTLILPPRRHRPRVEDSDEDIPLSLIREEKLNILKKRKNMEKMSQMKFAPFVKNRDLKEFKYWTRWYHWTLEKSFDLNNVFHVELHQNFPKSFYFVIKECGMLAGCTPYRIYKCMSRLEQRIMV